jgi:hypothetical protein
MPSRSRLILSRALLVFWCVLLSGWCATHALRCVCRRDHASWRRRSGCAARSSLHSRRGAPPPVSAARQWHATALRQRRVRGRAWQRIGGGRQGSATGRVFEGRLMAVRATTTAATTTAAAVKTTSTTRSRRSRARSDGGGGSATRGSPCMRRPRVHTCPRRRNRFERFRDGTRVTPKGRVTLWRRSRHQRRVVASVGEAATSRPTAPCLSRH